MAEVLEMTRATAAKSRNPDKSKTRPVSEAPPIIAKAAEAAGMGDNLSPEQEAKALRIYHVSKLRAQKQRCDGAKALLDTERQVLTDLMHVAKADTHIERQEFSALLKAMDTSKTELLAREERRAILWADWDLPVGHQGDLFEKLPQEARDEQHAKGMGYAAGLRGDPCQMPENMQPRFGQAFGSGWGKGQEELAWALEAVGRRTLRKAAGGPTADEIKRTPEEDPDPAAEAAKLKAAGWTKPTGTAEDDPRETLPPSVFDHE